MFSQRVSVMAHLLVVLTQQLNKQHLCCSVLLIMFCKWEVIEKTHYLSARKTQNLVNFDPVERCLKVCMHVMSIITFSEKVISSSALVSLFGCVKKVLDRFSQNFAEGWHIG